MSGDRLEERGGAVRAGDLRPGPGDDGQGDEEAQPALHRLRRHGGRRRHLRLAVVAIRCGCGAWSRRRSASGPSPTSASGWCSGASSSARWAGATAAGPTRPYNPRNNCEAHDFAPWNTPATHDEGPETVALEDDFEAWLDTLPERDRGIVTALPGRGE